MAGRGPIRRTRRKLLKWSPWCAYCKKILTAETVTIDHVVPLSKGGSRGRSNLVLCCSKCNGEKKDMTVEEFRKWRREKTSV